MFIIKDKNIYNVSSVQKIRLDKKTLRISFGIDNTSTICFKSKFNAKEAYEVVIAAIVEKRSVILYEPAEKNPKLSFYVWEAK